MPAVGLGAGATLYVKFTSRDTGVPFTLAGSPVVSIYKDASTTESTAGVTLTVDFDARTGLNHISINTNADTTFYAAGHHYEVVLTAGTVNSTSVVGEVVLAGGFDIVAAAINYGVIYTATCPSQAGMTSTQITLDSGASAANQAYQWDAISIVSGTGAGDSRYITNYVGSSKLATVDSAWAVQPDSTSVFVITPTARVLVVNYATGQDPGTLSLSAFATPSDSVQASPSPTTTAFAGSSALSATANQYVGSVILFTSGVNQGLARKCTAYNSSTKLVTVTTAWPAAPTAADTFRFIGDMA